MKRLLFGLWALASAVGLSAAVERRYFIEDAIAPTQLLGEPGDNSIVVRQALTPDELAATQPVSFALMMRNLDELNARIGKGEVLSVDELTLRYFPLRETWQKVARWVTAQGFKVEAEDMTHLTVIARGSVALTQSALQMHFARVVGTDGEEYTSAVTPPAIPEEFKDSILGVLELQPHLQPIAAQTVNIKQIDGNFVLPQTFASLYNATDLGVDGSGQTIVILGSAHVDPNDLTAFWQTCGLPTTLAQFTELIVDTRIAVGPPSQAFESTMDIEWASAMAPGASIVYIPSTSMDVITPWIISQLATGRRVHQLSVSFVGFESTYTLPATVRAARSQYYATLAAAGVSIFYSSGDWGTTQRVVNGLGNLSYDATGITSPGYPASDPNVTGVGGTTVFFSRKDFLFATNPVTEGAWSLRHTSPQGGTASGGGVSLYFPRPSWQTGPGLPPGDMRCVPDVAALASSNFYPYFHFLGGKRTAGGTSVSAPIWGGLCALINQARTEKGLSPLGLLGPKIYPLIGTSCFNQMTTGSNDGTDGFSDTATNGAYAVGPNYTLITGVGSPNVGNLIAALTLPEPTTMPTPTTPPPTPTTTPTPSTPASSSKGGGGGAPSDWFFAALGLLLLIKKLTKHTTPN